MEYAWATPGTKCQCVSKGKWRWSERTPLWDRIVKRLAGPKRGEVVTIVSVGKGDPSGRICLTLKEWPREIYGVFPAYCFHPLISKDQDVELFKHLLTPIHDLSDETLAGELALDAANGRHT